MTSIFSIPLPPSGHGNHSLNNVASNLNNVATNLTNKSLREENKALNAEVAENRRKIASLAKQLSAASADVAKSVKSVAKYDALEETLRICRKERDQVKCDLTKSHQEKDDMKAVIQKLQEQVQQMEKTHQDQMATSKEKNEALKSLLETVSAQAVDMTSRKEAVEANFMASQHQVQALQEELVETNQKQKLLLQDLKIVTAEKVELTKKVNSLGDNIQAYEQRRKQTEAKNAALTSEIQSVQRNLHNLSVQHENLHSARNTLAATLTARDKTIQTQRETIQHVETEKTSKIAELERVSTKLGMVSHSHDIALVEIDDLKDTLSKTKETMNKKEEESQQKLSSLQTQLGQLSMEKQDLENDLQETINNLMSTREEVASLKDKIADREDKIKEEKEKLVELGCSEKVQVLNGAGKISFSDSYF